LLDDLARLVERHLDVPAIAALATLPTLPSSGGNAVALPPPGQRIALARDAAFSFIYPHLLRCWQRAGAEIVPFSPLADEPPGDDCDCCWLPGGYPELHAGPLAAATRFRDGVTRFATTRPVHGECGGFMVLGERLQDADGAWHRMAGLLGHASSFASRRINLGYREATLLADCAIGHAGAVVRGHEFHYATVADPGAGDPLVDLADASGRSLGLSGERRGRVSGTFFHAIAGADT
jgi:cobyrinic acid a,c-diamide synthase